MQRIKLAYLLILFLLTAAWLFADALWPGATPITYGAFRTVFLQYSGIIAIAAMSLAMLLALRPKWLDTRFDGLDKIYRLHKWLGITALVMSVLHWWLAQGTKWMVQWGWLQRPARRGRPDFADLGLLEAWLRSQRGFAETLGEWAFYLAFGLMLLALVKRFPYHLFQKTHKGLAVTYLVLVLHALVLVKFSYWRQPIGWLLALLLAGGSYAAVLVLLGRVGAGRKHRATIAALRAYPQAATLAITLDVASGWPGHRAGQFAFVTFDGKEGAHPFTMASAWHPDERRITFVAKALGDHTTRLPLQLCPGQAVDIEGPYGRFDFDDTRLAPPPMRQIWIGAGIGITPFLARLHDLAKNPGQQPVDLFHPVSQIDPAAIARLQTEAHAAGVHLHIVDSQTHGRLNGTRIRELVPDWRNASVWFCGPRDFARTIHAELVAHGLPPARFHRELFDMR